MYIVFVIHKQKTDKASLRALYCIIRDVFGMLFMHAFWKYSIFIVFEVCHMRNDNYTASTTVCTNYILFIFYYDCVYYLLTTILTSLLNKYHTVYDI